METDYLKFFQENPRSDLNNPYTVTQYRNECATDTGTGVAVELWECVSGCR